MRRLVPSFAAVCLLATLPIGSRAQTPTASAAPAVPTLQTTTQLVVVDVVVTDKDRKPVQGLKKEDFALADNGKPQQVLTFEDHSAPPLPAAPLPKLPAGVFTNYAPVTEGAPVNVLLLDTLNTPLTDQQYLRQQVVKYLQTATPGTRLAIFVLGEHLRMLQGFTTDTELLKKIVNDPKAARNSALLSDDLADDVSELSSDPTMTDTALVLEQFETLEQSFQTQLRVQYTLDGMDQLARYLSGIPGRKNLIWFSGAFPLVLMPDQDLQNPFMSEATFSTQFYATASLLEKSRVAVYPVDAHGLQTLATPNISTRATPTQINRAMSKASNDIADAHITMDQLAYNTGGQPFYNTNGLKEAVESAVAQGSNFYTLIYRPDAAQSDTEHSISVKLAKAGYTLAYRRSYLAESASPRRRLSAPPEIQDRKTAAGAPESHLVKLALMHGAPGPTQIVFDTGIAPIADPPTDKLLRGNIADADLKGPYQTFSVNTICVGSTISTTLQPDGRSELRVRFIILLYSPDGKLMNRTSSTMESQLTPEGIAMLRKQGLLLHQEVSIPMKGDYSIRVAVQDLAKDTVGALEIPVNGLRKMTPLQRPAPPAAAAPKPSL